MDFRSVIVVCVILLAYVILGGLVFHYLEDQAEEAQKETLAVEVSDFLENNRKCIDEDELTRFMNKIIDAYKAGIIYNKTTEYENWGIHSSIFFATTIVSTIGYGNIAPVTSGGRVFCVFFAIIGIPLFLVAASGVGEKISDRLRRIYNRFTCLPAKTFPKSSHAIKITILFLISVTCFMVIPAAIFQEVEDWNYLESLYYCFITFTTIGLGDFVPAVDAATEWYRLIVGIWILLGLSWMAGLVAEGQNALQHLVDKRENTRQERKNNKVEQSAREANIQEERDEHKVEPSAPEEIDTRLSCPL